MGKLKTIIWTIVLLWLVAFLLSKSFSIFSDTEMVSEGIAIIEIHSPISVDSSNSLIQSSLSSSAIVSDIENAEKNSGIKAIILDINSGGGGPVASREIVQAVKKAKKPTIALIREVGASGAYWIASSADYIVADPLSITGSVGVIGSYLDLSGLLKRYDIKYESMTAGEYKDMGTPYRELTAEERALLQQKLNLIQEVFIQDVAKNRRLNKEQITEIRKASFYLGIEAKQLNLVDELGGRDLAIKKAKELGKIKDENLVEYKKKESILDLLQKFSSKVFYAMGQGIGSELALKEELNIQT